MPARTPSIVAVGASAGGLEALEHFFSAVPENTGLAFVVIQHLSPDFKSVMDDLLARRTAIPIRQAIDGTEIEGDTIYLNPAKCDLRIAQGRFETSLQDHLRQIPLPIDAFMTSLAEELGDRAAAVILSGSGSDGSRGAARVKEAGGRVFAQSAETAKFDSMPRAAIATGAVDFVGTPAEIAQLAVMPPQAKLNLGPVDGDGPSPITELFDLMCKATGLDFEQYRQGTVMRRLERRMQLLGHDDVGAYVEVVREQASEREALLRDLLIEVTRFFRDPEAFEVLKAQLGGLVRDANEPVRVWVPGCATGEEAYSWAILLMEATEGLSPEIPVKIFATDIHRNSLEQASCGRYSRAALENVPTPLLHKYFEEDDGRFQVTAELRARVVFAEHNILKDPPFTRVDAVSCRNLLIYLEPTAQEDVLARFLFALKNRGLLFLGPSETIGRLENEFVSEDRHWRLFRKQVGTRLASGLHLPRPAPVSTRAALTTRPTRAIGSRLPIRRAAYDQLLERFVPEGFLVDAQGQLQHTFGDAGRYLELSGPVTNSLTNMLVGDLRVAISAALRRAAREQTPVAYGQVQVQLPNRVENVTIAVEPLLEFDAGSYFVAVRRSEPVPAPAPEETYPADALTQLHLRDLEAQLHESRETLQLTVEELETSNEEFQATNEELLASNEELQSTNEELQSVNEELYTVNAEYEKRNQELLETNRDLSNLMNCTDIGTIFLDERLCIRKFTPAIMSAFNLREQDVGRPLSDIASTLSDEAQFHEQAQHVLSTGHSFEHEITTTDGHHYLQRITPYRSERGTVEGVVISFVDLSNEWRIRQQMVRAKALQTSLMESLSANLGVLDGDGKILAHNSAWAQFAAASHDTDALAVGANYFAAYADELTALGQEEAHRMLAGVRDVLRGRKSTFGTTYTYRAKEVLRWFHMTVTPVDLGEGEFGAVILQVDVTDLREARSKLALMHEAVSHAEIGYFVTDAEGRIESINEAFTHMTGYAPAELIGRNTRMLRSGAHSRAFYQSFWRTLHQGQRWSGQFVNRRKDGTEFVAETIVSPVTGDGDKPVAFITFARDVTDSQRLDERIRRTQKLETVGQLAGGIAHDFNNLLTPIIGYAEMLLEELDQPSARLLAQPILEAATMAQDVTRQLLTFSRKQPTQLANFDLEDLVSDFSGMLRRLVREDIEIVYDARRPPLPVEADRAQVEQVLLNLAINAQDAMPRGGKLTIRTDRLEVAEDGASLHADLDPGPYALLSVIDDGEGISPEVIDRLFEPFFTTKASGKGTGLGLATAYGVARRHGGVILVKSAVGEGSTFTLCLPSSAAESKSQPVVGAPIPPAVPGTGERVFVVEDDPRVRKFTVRLLRSGGYEVQDFDRAQAALEALQKDEGAASLVLSDIVMPDMSGPELVERLRVDNILTPILFMSGYPGDVFGADAVDETPEVVAKPFTKQTLLHAVRRVIDREPQAKT